MLALFEGEGEGIGMDGNHPRRQGSGGGRRRFLPPRAPGGSDRIRAVLGDALASRARRTSRAGPGFGAPGPESPGRNAIRSSAASGEGQSASARTPASRTDSSGRWRRGGRPARPRRPQPGEEAERARRTPGVSAASSFAQIAWVRPATSGILSRIAPRRLRRRRGPGTGGQAGIEIDHGRQFGRGADPSEALKSGAGDGVSCFWHRQTGREWRCANRAGLSAVRRPA
jgi:hypothetical protein